MGVINPQQRLARLAYATHRRKQLFGRREVTRLGFVGVVTKLVYVGNQTIAAAEQAAAFRWMLATRVVCYRSGDRVSDLNSLTVQQTSSASTSIVVVSDANGRLELRDR